MKLMSVLLLCNLAWPSLAQEPNKLPTAIKNEIARMDKMCIDAGGTAGASNIVKTLDFTGDGRIDYVLQESEYVCSGAVSLFAGNGGSQVMLFIGTADMNVQLAFASTSFAVRFDHKTAPVTIELGLGGTLCGQKVTAATSRAESTPCWRPLRWDLITHKLELAPIEKIKPIN